MTPEDPPPPSGSPEIAGLRPPPATAVPPIAPLQKFGRYLIYGLLGQGGMGSVYLAEQTGPGKFRRRVALKLIHADKAVDGEQRQMLLDEAQLTALIGHPAVVTMFEVGEQFGRVFIALELVNGISLATLMQRLGGCRLPVAVAAGLVAQACDGLHAAHEARRDGQPLNLIHRDVSLSNIMCDTGGRVRLIDFGIARAAVRKNMTGPASVRGNPAYMAPEQLDGQVLDRRVDIYSTALVFYELCTGQHPFKRSMVRVPLRPLGEVCDEVGPELDEAVAASLSLDPRGRPEQIRALGAALWQAARERGIAEPSQLGEYFRAHRISLEPPPPQREAVDLGPPVHRHSVSTRPDPSPVAPAVESVLVELGADDERERELTLPDGSVALLYINDVNPCERGDHPLALSRVPGLLPAPLQVGYAGRALRIWCDASTQSGSRLGLYVDAQQPQTRLEALLLSEASLPHAFDVGHRKSAVRQVHYAVGRREGQATVARPRAAPLTISTAGDTSLLAVLTARDDSGLLHIECVRVRR
jgi:serine/threonine-protein kinase